MILQKSNEQALFWISCAQKDLENAGSRTGAGVWNHRWVSTVRFFLPSDELESRGVTLRERASRNGRRLSSCWKTTFYMYTRMRQYCVDAMSHGSRPKPRICWSAWISVSSWFACLWSVIRRPRKNTTERRTWSSWKQLLGESFAFPFLRNRIDGLLRTRMEELSAWVADIKGSDYTTLKEKVTTLEMGLKTIGEDAWC